MVSLLDSLPIEVLKIIWDYKLEMEEMECFYAFLDRIYGKFCVYAWQKLVIYRFLAFYRISLD